VVVVMVVMVVVVVVVTMVAMMTTTEMLMAVEGARGVSLTCCTGKFLMGEKTAGLLPRSCQW
jgi:hypothetical protein